MGVQVERSGRAAALLVGAVLARRRRRASAVGARTARRPGRRATQGGESGQPGLARRATPQPAFRRRSRRPARDRSVPRPRRRPPRAGRVGAGRPRSGQRRVAAHGAAPRPPAARARPPTRPAWNGSSGCPSRTDARPGVRLRDAGGVRRVDDVGALDGVGDPQGDPQVRVRADLGRDDAAGPLGGQHQVDAEGAPALGDVDQAGHEVGQLAGQLANSSMTMSRRGIGASRRARRRRSR